MFLCHGWWPVLYLGVFEIVPTIGNLWLSLFLQWLSYLILGVFTSLLAFLSIGSQRHCACTSVRGPITEIAFMIHPTDAREVIGPIWGWEAVTTCRCDPNILVQVQTAKEMRVAGVGIRNVNPPTSMSTNVTQSRSDFLQSIMWNTRNSDSKSGTYST
jgi:hypothetical protein